MKKNSEIILTTSLHDPENRQLAAAKELLAELSQFYCAICVSVTDGTSSEFITFLEENNITYNQSKRSIGEGRREALSLALQHEGKYVQYCDFDRILHWIKKFPKELTSLPSVLINSDFLILGRTKRAYSTHPEVQQVTENISNMAFSIAYGKNADVTAGSCAMTRETAETLLNESTADINDTDTEWPMIALEKDKRVKYLQTEGLEFETPDYFQHEINEAGSLENWVEKTYDKPVMWKYRTKMTEESVKQVKKRSTT